MRFFLAGYLLLLSICSQAEIAFNGRETAIPFSHWEILNTQEAPPNPQELAANPDKYSWIALEKSKQLPIYSNQIIRADITVSESTPFDQAFLLVIAYAFIPQTEIGLAKDGELLSWDKVSDQQDQQLAGFVNNQALGMVRLPFTEPGNYQLFVAGSEVANRHIAHEATLFTAGDFMLREYPRKVAYVAAFVGILATYALFSIGLLLYRYHLSFLFALIFLSGALLSIVIREGILFLSWDLDSSWWARHVMPLALNMTYGGIILYLATDLKYTPRRLKTRLMLRARQTLYALGALCIALGVLSLALPVREYVLIGISSIVVTLLGFALALVLILWRSFSGYKRHIIFALVFGSFIVMIMLRTLTTFTLQNFKISDEPWYLLIDLIGTYIFAEYLWVITREYVTIQKRQAADSTRFDMVNRFSHELRTPLNAVIGLADLLKTSKEISAVKGYAGMIQKAGNTLLELVNDILDFSKLGHSSTALDNKPFRLDRTITEALYNFHGSVIEQKIFIQSLLDPSLNFFLIGDELRLKQIISNLVSNAFKFSPAHSTIRLEINRGQERDNKIELLCSVSDSGRGIPAEELVDIFEPFKQVETEDNSRLGGTGLGLSICKLLVEQMGGEIQAESTVGIGTSFSFNVWLEKDPDGSDLSESFAPIANKRALVISQLENVVSQLSQALEYWGAEVFACDSCRTAPEGYFDLVILESEYSSNAADVDWIDKLPEKTNVLIYELKHKPWFNELEHQSVNFLKFPTPIISVLKRIAEILGGHKLDLKQSTTAQGDSADCAGHCVLLVDDNTVNLVVASKLLHSLNADNQSAQGGAKALELLRSGNRYSLMLLDCEMPDIDGFEVCRQWREHEEQHDMNPMPIVALTAHALDEVKEKCLQAGMNEVLYKPVGREALQKLLRQYPEQ